MTDAPAMRPDTLERYCELMHDAYEAAAAGNGWETQQASRKPWADVPEANKATMRAAVAPLAAAVRQATIDEVAELIERRCAEVFPPDVFIPPTPEQIAEAHALLTKDGATVNAWYAHVMRFAHLAIVAELRALRDQGPQQ